MYGEKKRYDSRKPQLQYPLQEPTAEPDAEERIVNKRTLVEKAQNSLASTAEKMKSKYDRNTSQTLLSLGDLVYIRREHTKKGFSKKLSTVYHELSKVVDINHPKNVKSGKEGWVHHNRLRRKTPFEDPDLIVQSQPLPPSETHELLDDDMDDEFDYPTPMIINNSDQGATETVPTMPTANDEINNDNITPVFLDEGENQIVDATPSLPRAAAASPPLGRNFNENGRLVSSRVKKSTQTEEFNY